MAAGKFFALIGVGLVMGLIIAVILGLFTDLPPVVVGGIIGVVVAPVAGRLGTRL